jgi:integrase
MAHIEDRWMRKARGLDGKVALGDDGKPVLERHPERYGKGSRWRLRYDGPDGREKNESYGKKVDADKRKIEVEADLLRGTYISPDAGKVTFRKFAAEVIANRTLNPSSRAVMSRRLERHVHPVIGSKELGLLARRPSLIQGLVNKMESAKLGPDTIEAIMAHVQLVFTVAIEDELILKNPVLSKTVKLPKVVKKKLVVWTADRVLDMRETLAERYQATVDVGAGIGLRHGEIFGFGPDDVDWFGDKVEVNRQLKVLNGRVFMGLPKGDKTREVPLSESVKFALAEHMRLFPPTMVTLPWGKPDGDPVTVRLFFSNTHGGAVYPPTFTEVWQRALTRVGIVPKLTPGEKRGDRFRVHGMHMLRHYFASVLLTDGESPKAVADWMGHSDGGVLLLRTYAHLMPVSEQRMKKTIDAALRRPETHDRSESDGPQTAHGIAGSTLTQLRAGV